jgi:hypothetical protein
MSTHQAAAPNDPQRIPTERPIGTEIVVDGVSFTLRGSLITMDGNRRGADSGIEVCNLQPTVSSQFDPIEHWTLFHRKVDGSWDDVSVYCATTDHDHRLDGAKVPIEAIHP